MSDWLPMIFVMGILLLPVALILINAFVTAPMGYEDAEGFHYGEQEY